ncbi:unnamed protein product [Rotaria sp. Silwood2]|nr:unnamed protein product [Rotaria sp. Silwood2]CAF3919056.1 unnamed protein product [Rotaria sp. Silwood2]
MEDFIITARAELRKLNTFLTYDIEEFNRKLNSTREHFCNYIQRQIQNLLNVEKEYKQEFDYLDEENKKTCENNRQQFNKLCISINQNDNNPIIVKELLKDFQGKFPLRPLMLKSIPEYYFKDIDINDLIRKQKINENEFEDNYLTLPTADYNSFSTNTNDQLLTENKKQDHHFNSYSNNKSELLCSSNRSSPVRERSFIPVQTSTADDTESSPIVSGSIGSSYHKQLASQNNEIGIEPQSRLVSTCSTINGPDMMIDLLFKIPYQHNRNPRLLSYHENEKYLLIYSLYSHQLESLCLNSHQFSVINLPSNEYLLNIGYSTNYNLFYFSTQQTKNFVLFRLNQQQIDFENKLYDDGEQSPYVIIDFAVNNFYISFLVRLKNINKFMIVIHDSATMNRLHSFDLIDAFQPLSIISTDKKSNSTTTTMCNDQIELLLFVNDLKSHLIHCCTHQQYLIPIQVNAFGICPLNDGNLALVASKDIRGLKVQSYLQQHNVQFD